MKARMSPIQTLISTDFIGNSFTTAPDGKLYQLPDQQFANLYWFRYDWFNDEKNKADFKAKYGYDLGVPVNWSAYEDIAEFFTGREIDGKKVYGHMDYGKKDPSLGWRFTDAWLSMAGNGDKGIPNGLPVDEWGIKVDENSRPVGSCVARGGDTNGPAAVYSIAEVSRVAQGLCAAGSPGHDLLRVRSGPGRKAKSPSRCSCTPPSPPTWSRKACRSSMRTARRSGASHRRRMASTGRKA